MQRTRKATTRMEANTHHDFLLFVFCFSFRFAAFFNLPSSSWTFTPSTRAPAFSHFSRSALAARSASGSAASFSLCAASCARACVGFDAVVGRDFFAFAFAWACAEVEASLAETVENAMEANFDLGS